MTVMAHEVDSSAGNNFSLILISEWITYVINIHRNKFKLENKWNNVAYTFKSIYRLKNKSASGTSIQSVIDSCGSPPMANSQRPTANLRTHSKQIENILNERMNEMNKKSFLHSSYNDNTELLI